MTAVETSKKVAVIGLGAIGYGIAPNLAREGRHVVGTDTNPAALARFGEPFGTAISFSREAATGAEVVILVVMFAG
jgi:L-threonate 2-dehydrogenase